MQEDFNTTDEQTNAFEPEQPAATTNEQTTTTCECKKKCKCNCTNCLIITNVVMFIGLVVIYILHFAGIGTNSKVNDDATPAVVPENGVLKVAYINSDTLIAKYQYARDLEAELKQYRDAQEANYKRQIEQYQKDYQNFIKTGDQLTLTQQKAKEEELKKRLEKLQGLEGELTMQIQEKLTKENEKMLNAIFAYVREYNQANQQFDIILRKTFNDSPTMYMNPAMDITNEIVDGLNKEYADIKGKDK